MSNPFDLTGKTAIVTGANTGIGQGIAGALARAGARVVGVGRSAMDETRAEIETADGKFHPVAADLSTTEPIKRIVDEAAAWAGRVDILVNNAGIVRRADPLDYTEQDWDDVINLNLKATFFLAQAFARRIVAQDAAQDRGREPQGGKIVNIASVLAFQGGIRIPPYTASKHGVVGLTRLLANEWAGKRINVNAIAPGYCVTNNTQAIRDDPDRNAAILARIPAGRWGTPADMGGAAVFLSSAASDYCHGSILTVDGGWLAR